MRGPSSRPARVRPLLAALAALFAAGNLLYSGVWIYYIRMGPAAGLGAELRLGQGGRSLEVVRIPPDSAAARIGLQPGDRVLAVDGRAPTGLYLDVERGHAGQRVAFTIERPGRAGALTLWSVLEPPPNRPPISAARWWTFQLVDLYPLPFLAVGLTVLFLRLEDRNAWLLALLFACFIAQAPFLMIEPRIPPPLRSFGIFWKTVFAGLAPALFAFFFAVFPIASSLDRRWPWLKRVLLIGALAVCLPLGAWCWWAGGSRPLQMAARTGPAHDLLGLYSTGGFLFGLASLVANARSADPAARRKTRVIMWGTVIGFTPALALGVVTGITEREPYELGFGVWMPTVLALFVMPLSFAYAVVKHRVLAVPVLLQRSARYLLVRRGFAALTVVAGLAATLALAASFSRVLSVRTPLAVPAGLVVGAGFGALLVSAGMRVERRVASRIDRAFFRTAYDARQILEDLADHVRVATERRSLAVLLERQLREALHPRRLILYLEDAHGRLRVERGVAPPALESVAPSLPVLLDLARRTAPWEVPPQASLDGLEALEPECLVPLLGRQSRLLGVLVLGERLSEEPYSREDRRLLWSVAGQAGIALENIELAERMAERLEAERRAAQEMDIAKQVQSRLFPQVKPALRTLEYAGGCRQARAVGGDYYDFLDLGPGRLGLVLADVAGKGISAALLMATLQASLRSQHAAAADPARLLCAVNRVFYPSASPSRYATLFFGDYDDSTRRLRYANCGHNPPVLLRAGGDVERLAPTATVLGLFDDWDVSTEEVALASGDLLLIFSDGASEAWSDDGEEFGEERLIRALRAHRHRAVTELLELLADEISRFSGREQEDDLTLVAARVR